VLSIIEAAGWPIWFILVTSVVALAIIGIRAFTLYRVLGDEARPEILKLLACLVPIVVAYGWIRYLKKSGRLTEYRAPGVETS